MRHPATLDTGLAPESTTPNNADISTGYVIDQNKCVPSHKGHCLCKLGYPFYETPIAAQCDKSGE